MKQAPISNLILDLTKDLIWVVDTKLNLVHANKAYLSLMTKVTGTDKKINTPVFVEGFGDDSVEKWKAYYNRALLGDSFEIEEHYYNPETNEIQFSQVTFTPIFEEDKKINLVACRSADVTRIVKHKPETNQLTQDAKEIIEEEQQLKLLEKVINSTSDAIVITEGKPLDKPGPAILYVNNAFTEMTGYTAEEVLGKNPRFLQGPDSNKKELKKLGEKLRRLESAEITVLNYTKSGEEYWVHFAVSPVTDQKGKITHLISIQRDVTEQMNRHIERELISQISYDFSDKEELVPAATELCKSLYNFGKFDLIELWCPNIELDQIKLFAQHTKIKCYETSEDSSILFEKNVGLPGVVWQSGKLQLWDTNQIDHNFVRKTAATELGLKSVLGMPLTFSNKIVGVLVIGSRKDSAYLKKQSIVLNKLGKFIGSEINRKKLESDLKHLYDTIPDILCITDLNGIFLKINKAGCDLLGYSQEEILFQPYDKFLHPEDINSFANNVKLFSKKAKTFHFENRYLTKDGQVIWLSWSCITATHDGLIYASAKNISEEKKLRELNAQANTLAKIGAWEIDLEKSKVFWSKMVHQLHETNPSFFTPSLETGINFYREDFRELVASSIENSIVTGKGFDFEAVIITQNLKERWVRAIGHVESINGDAKRIFGSFQDITDRKVHEIRLESFANNLPGVAFQYYLYPDGKDALKYVTQGSEKVWGFSAESVMNDNNLVWNQIQLGGEIELVKSSIAASIKNKSNWSAQWQYIMPNNESRVHAGYGSFNALPDDTIIFNSLILDITEEYKNKDLLNQATEQLSKAFKEKNEILESIGDAFFAVNKDWIVTYWNKQAEIILGRKKEDVVGKNIWDAYPDAIDSDFYRQYHKAMETGETINFEEHYDTLNMWIEVTVYPSKNGLSIYFKDITLRKKADDRLLKANERFEKVTQATNDAVWDWNIIENTLFWGSGFKTLFGYDVAKITPTLDSWIKNIHTADIERVEKSVNDAISNKKVTNWLQEYRYKKLDGSFAYVLDKGIIIRDNKGEAVRMVGAMTDFTKLKEQETKLVELNKTLKTYTKELERSNQELEQFAFITSHDLQEPLRMISSFMDQLKRKYSDQLDDKALQYIHFATDGAKRMKQIILDLLLYSRANKPFEDIEKVSLNELLKEYKLLRRKLIADKSAIISSTSLPEIVTHKAPITQIFHCILDNALNYSHKNIAPEIKINVIEKETEWEFSISDNGIGIDPQFFDKIFVVFQRLHNREDYDGTGIGLSIAKRSVEFLGGSIWLQSSLGQGSTFYFTISKKQTNQS